MTNKTVVLLPITVPNGIYCWEFDGHNICEHFDNEGGHASCGIFQYGDQKREVDGYRKCPECVQLRPASRG